MSWMWTNKLQHSKRPSVDELLSHPLLLTRFFPARPDNTLTRPLQPATNENDRAVKDAEIQARELRVNEREIELEKRSAELDGKSCLRCELITYVVQCTCTHAHVQTPDLWLSLKTLHNGGMDTFKSDQSVLLGSLHHMWMCCPRHWRRQLWGTGARAPLDFLPTF